MLFLTKEYTLGGLRIRYGLSLIHTYGLLLELSLETSYETLSRMKSNVLHSHIFHIQNSIGLVLELPQQNHTLGGLTTEIHFLTALEATTPRPGYWQDRYVLRFLSSDL